MVRIKIHIKDRAGGRGRTLQGPGSMVICGALYSCRHCTAEYTAHLPENPTKMISCYIISLPDRIHFCQLQIKPLTVWKLQVSTHQILVMSKSASLKLFLGKLKNYSIQKITNKGRKETQTRLQYLQRHKKSKSNQYWPMGHKNTTRSHTLCNNGPFKKHVWYIL